MKLEVLFIGFAIACPQFLYAQSFPVPLKVASDSIHQKSVFPIGGVYVDIYHASQPDPTEAKPKNYKGNSKTIENGVELECVNSQVVELNKAAEIMGLTQDALSKKMQEKFVGTVDINFRDFTEVKPDWAKDERWGVHIMAMDEVPDGYGPELYVHLEKDSDGKIKCKRANRFSLAAAFNSVLEIKPSIVEMTK